MEVPEDLMKDKGKDLSIDYFINLPYLQSVTEKVEVKEIDPAILELEEREKMLKMRKLASMTMYTTAYNRESKVKEIPNSTLTEIRSYLPSNEKKEEKEMSSNFFRLTEIPQAKKRKVKRNVVKAGTRISRHGRLKQIQAKVKSVRRKKEFNRIFINHAKQKDPVDQPIPKTPEAFRSFVRKYAKTPRIERRIHRERLLAKKEGEKILEKSKLASSRFEEEDLILDELDLTDLTAWESHVASVDTPTEIRVKYSHKYSL